MNTDDCVKHTCVNGGVCVDGVGNYTCRCPLQYTGKHHRGKASPSFGDASVCKGSREDSGICCLLLLLPLGRACEKLVDFCSPDLNPCQHEAQCVGTPDGPRSVPPTASDPQPRLGFLPPFLSLICWWIWSGFLRAIIGVAMGTALAAQAGGCDLLQLGPE